MSTIVHQLMTFSLFITLINMDNINIKLLPVISCALPPSLTWCSAVITLTQTAIATALCATAAVSSSRDKIYRTAENGLVFTKQ